MAPKGLVAVPRVVLLHLDEEVRVAQADPVPNGRAVHAGVEAAADLERHG
jgi:hypothetical protein